MLLNPTFSDGMPVRSLSRRCSSIKYSLPEPAIERNSSSSALTPEAITPPLSSFTGGSSAISRPMRSYIPGQGLNCSAKVWKAPSFVPSHNCFIRATASNERFNCCNSRGLIRPTDTLEISLSKSPTARTWGSNWLAKSRLRTSMSTTCSRSSMAARSFSGITIHRRSSRDPIGVAVWSSTSNSVRAFSCGE